jgi:membrane protease YdiL (CAAX protease family)
VKSVVRPVSTVGFLGLHNAYRGVAAGVIAGIVWAGAAFSVDGRPALHFVPTLTLLWVIAGTPIAEEFTFRGVVLPGLHNGGIGFWKANLLTSLLFLLVHCVGWCFQGTLTANLNPMLVGGILLVSLVAGWLRHRTDSLYSGMVLHAVNNLYSSLR